jgi:hypothetical protein
MEYSVYLRIIPAFLPIEIPGADTFLVITHTATSTRNFARIGSVLSGVC